MHLFYARQAEDDIDDILAYVASDSPAAAGRVLGEIFEAAERLADFPNLGRPGRVPRTREWPIPSLPYVIIYEAAVDAVTVVAVFHGARNVRRAMAERRKARNRSHTR